MEDFLSLLRQYGIGCLVDVRAYPSSKRHPHYSRLHLEASLSTLGIRYVFEGADLGGMRRPARQSPHTGLTDAAFRGYAEHMATADFAAALSRLVDLGKGCRLAFMCAEAMPQHCHRAFIADALVVGGAQVWHLVSPSDARLHALHPALRQGAGALVYDTGQQLALGF